MRSGQWVAFLIALVGLAAYSNSFHGPFIFDDLDSILNNPTIRHLWPIGSVFSPPCNGETVSGRPILNLSFAINYALSGTNVWGYHITNLAIHLLNGLLLLGILRRTLLLPALQPRFGRAALLLSSAIALLWVVHPLQTEAVTYTVQRAESLAAMFYLLVLYTVIRGSQSGQSTTGWYLVAVGVCWLGIAAKEIVATAPVMVLLYDRALLAGTFRQALQRRWGLYLGLTVSWALLIGLMIQRGFVSTAITSDMPGIWEYIRTQPGVILYYLRQILWPSPLCLDHCWLVAETWSAIGLPMLGWGLLLGVAFWGLRHSDRNDRRAWGLLGAWFFLTLAPSSSIVPLISLACEHRMYLPLAAVITLLVIGAYLVGQKWVMRGRLAIGLCLVSVVVVAFGLLTFQRNRDYRSEMSIWEDAVMKIPYNFSAHNNLGNALVSLGRLSEAIEHFRQALQLKPNYFEAHNNLGNALMSLGQPSEAIEHFRQALQLRSNYAPAYHNWGLALWMEGRSSEAMKHFERAIQLDPNDVNFYCSASGGLLHLGRPLEAIEYCKKALELQPNYADAHYNWGNALLAMNQPAEAIPHFEQAVQLKPNDADAYNNLSVALLHVGRFDEAVATAKAARQLALAAGKNSLAEEISMRLQLYRNQKPSREPAK